MPYSKVVQAELTAEGPIDVTVELAHLEPGERALVQTTVTQADGAVAEVTALVTGAAPAGPQRAHLLAVPRTGTFKHTAELVAFSQATTVWSTVLQPVPDDAPDRPLWAAAEDDDWDDDEG